MAKLIVVLADLQIPDHDPRYLRVMKKFIAAVRPDEVGQIGDLMDQPEVGRWNKGAAGEFAGTFWKGVETTRILLEEFQFDWVRLGNHDERMEVYIDRYAPALGGADSMFTLESVLGAKNLRTRFERKPFKLAPGWIAAHGHEGGLSPVAGRTAYGLALRWDQSVVCGHTHRAGTVSTTVGVGRNRRRITGMEIGHGMLESRATYIKSAAPNWQRAFGLFVVEGGKTYDQLVMMNPDCSFSWDGRIFRP